MMLDLSLEFLMGRALDNAMLNTGMKDIASGKQWGIPFSWMVLTCLFQRV